MRFKLFISNETVHNGYIELSHAGFCALLRQCGRHACEMRHASSQYTGAQWWRHERLRQECFTSTARARCWCQKRHVRHSSVADP